MHKVAIIEDNPSIQQMYRFKLESAGYSVKTANNGVEGLELIESFDPALILLDIKMPQMCGDEMLAILRGSDKGAAIKVIILTNISRDEAPRSLSLLHIDRYVVKAHYTPTQVTEIVTELLAA